MADEQNQYEQERRAKRDQIRALGIDPYGGRVEGLRPLSEVRSSYKPEMGHDSGPVVKVAGRIVLKRDFGKKLSFLTLRDDSGNLQVALDAKRLPEQAWQLRDLLDLGDQLVAEGALGTTKTGEVTVWATSISMASKALLPPPAKHEGLADVETRYRQRYVDLWSNPEVMQIMRLRIRVVEEVRAFMRERGFLEVETPMMQVLHGGAAAKPFKTHHNALDIPLYLRVAPELFLKRLLVGGFTKIFEVNRNFRNEGISPRHNPEFTMLEAYEAYGSWETMAELVESMICRIAQNVFGGLRIKRADGREINLEGDSSNPVGYRWPRAKMPDLVEQRTGWKFDKRGLRDASPALFQLLADVRANKSWDDWKDLLDRMPSSLTTSLVERITWPRMRAYAETEFERLTPAEQLVETYEKLVEPTLIDPVFVTQVPSVIVPLARENKEDPFFCDVYELAMNGIEISPGYTELNDPDKQREHFTHQVGDKEEQQKVDEDFLTALKYGMPPAGGMGLGIDRLVMTLTGAESLRDVILFPLMKPHG